MATNIWLIYLVQPHKVGKYPPCANAFKEKVHSIVELPPDFIEMGSIVIQAFVSWATLRLNWCPTIFMLSSKKKQPLLLATLQSFATRNTQLVRQSSEPSSGTNSGF